MTVTGLGIAVSRMVSEYGGRGEEAGNILKTARLMFLGIARWRQCCCLLELDH